MIKSRPPGQPLRDTASMAGRRSCMTALAAALWLGARAGRANGATPAASPPLDKVEPVTITIDTAKRYQIMDGFGTSTRLFDDPHVFETYDPKTKRAATVMSRAQQDEVLDRLYTDLGLTRLRPIFEIGGFEPINDNDDPNIANLARFDFSWKNNDGYVEFAKRAMARGVRTVFPAALGFEKWMLHSRNPAEAAEWILTRIRRWRELGIELPYYSVINEPGYSRSGYWSGEFIRDVIKIAGPKLRADGLKTTFVVPDDWDPKQAYLRSRVILADDEARKYVGALAYHLYAANEIDLEAMRKLGLRYDLPIWMTEYSLFDPVYWQMMYRKRDVDFLDWGVLMHDLIARYNVSAVDYIWGFFGEWEASTTHLIRLRYQGSQYQGYELTKQYFVTGQFSRFVRPGARRIEAVSSHRAVLASAFVDGAKLAVVALNTGRKDVSMVLNIVPQWPNGSILSVMRTSAQEDGIGLKPVRVDGATIAIVLPAASITTLASPARPASSP